MNPSSLPPGGVAPNPSPQSTNITPADVLSAGGPTAGGQPTDSSWRTPEKRQLVIRKIAETVKMFPDVLARNPADVETSIFQRAKSEHDYMNMVGKIVLSIRQKGLLQQQQQQQQWGPPGAGMMGPPHGGGMDWSTGMRPAAATGYPPSFPHPSMNPYPPPPPRMMAGPYGQPMIPPPHPIMRAPQYIRPQLPPPPPSSHRAVPPMAGSGEHIVSAVPNPSYPVATERPPGAPSPFAPPPAPPTNHPPANSPKPTSVPSPRSHPLPSPNTPWNPNSPTSSPKANNNSTSNNAAGAGVTPEANAAVLVKLQELQPYIPLLARMIDRLARGDRDKARSDQLHKLSSLYNVLQSKNMKVSLQTLEKCHVALKKIFEKDQPPHPPTTAPSTVPSAEATPPRPPVPPTPPISSLSLHDFKILHSPPPLSSYLQPVMDDWNDPLDRLSPSKRRKLDEQASKAFLCSIKRELTHLNQFNIKQVPATTNDIALDGSITLQCTIAPTFKSDIEVYLQLNKCPLYESLHTVDDSLPAMPPLIITVPSDYPDTSPHYNDTINDNTATTSSLVQSVHELLKDKLSIVTNGYTITHVLRTWESCILQVIAKELRGEI